MPGNANAQKAIPGHAGDWEFLFNRDMPFQKQLMIALYHAPGIFCALAIGVVVNVIVEDVARRINRRLGEWRWLNLIGVGVAIYLVFFTRFDLWIAAKIHWYKLVPYPR